MKKFRVLFMIMLLSLFAVSAVEAAQGQIKVATVSVQEILSESKAGKEAQQQLQAKVDEYQGKFMQEQKVAEGMREEIEKKSSVWSEAVRSEKERDYQKKMRELQLKSEDARYELQQLEKKIMAPILKELQIILTEFGQKNAYTLILETGMLSRNGLVYADETLDISDQVRKELDSRAGK